MPSPSPRYWTAVLEHVRVEPAEQRGEAVSRVGQAPEVVVELQLEEVAVLADVPGVRLREGERIVLAADLLGADADRGVGPHPEPHLAAVVEREREAAASDDQQQQRQEVRIHHRSGDAAPRRGRHRSLRFRPGGEERRGVVSTERVCRPAPYREAVDGCQECDACPAMVARYVGRSPGPRGRRGRRGRGRPAGRLRQRRELPAHDLLRLEAERAVVTGAIHHAVHDVARVGPAEREERLRGDVDAELLRAPRAPGAGVEGLARGEDAADRRRPSGRGRRPCSARPQVDEELARRG